ncbi:TatD family hydrolase [Candidatus Dependentiae bacterium]
MLEKNKIILVDTHCHINIMVKEKFDAPINSENFELAKKISLQAAHEGVDYILNAGTSVIECINCIKLAQQNKNMFSAVGIHPCDITAHWNKDLKQVIQFLQNKKENKIVAIGECGLDLYHQTHTLTQQKELLKAQIELSFEHNLPLTIHMRQATDEMVSCLQAFEQEFKKRAGTDMGNFNGVMHCFSESTQFAEYVISLGFAIGIGGPITYPKNNSLRETISQIDLSKIVLETDAPFLPPQIIRGKRNHPKYIKNIAENLAKIKNTSLNTIAQETTKNAFKLFKFETK